MDNQLHIKAGPKKDNYSDNPDDEMRFLQKHLSTWRTLHKALEFDSVFVVQRKNNMLLIKADIRSSSIHGLGLFASEFISKGTEIWRLSPRLDLDVSFQIVESYPASVKEFLQHYGYIDYRLNRYILCFDHARFINHSETPNALPDYKRDLSRVDVAIRDIFAGEEITIDYRAFGNKSLGF